MQLCAGPHSTTVTPTALKPVNDFFNFLQLQFSEIVGKLYKRLFLEWRIQEKCPTLSSVMDCVQIAISKTSPWKESWTASPKPPLATLFINFSLQKHITLCNIIPNSQLFLREKLLRAALESWKSGTKWWWVHPHKNTSRTGSARKKNNHKKI